jgi:UDP-glucose 4-epimerase
MTILITGSAGHLGEALMRRLRAEGRPAVGLDIKRSPFTDRVGSVTDRDFVRDCMRGARAVIHAATLHKPHIVTHGHQEFIDTNITGTLVLLEEALAAAVPAFVYTSTTSAFGSALTPAAGEPAAWITEDVVPIPKNIYGVSKLAAESLCEMFARRRGLPVVVLRTARFFPEEDDDQAMRQTFALANLQANELLFRRADIADVAEAHLLAADKAAGLGFARFIISATTPFRPGDLAMLRTDAPTVVRRLFPDCAELYSKRGWRLFPQIDRVYVNERARDELGWRPRCDFRHVLDCVSEGRDFRSALALEVGAKGYHETMFAEGPYPVA